MWWLATKFVTAKRNVSLMMHREIEITRDGSNTVAIPELNVTYHSRHGAVQESRHIYIEAALQYALPTIKTDTVSVFEMGFGTGLNALLTLQDATKLGRKIDYYAIELYPLTLEESGALKYDNQLGTGHLLMQLHQAAWGEPVCINEYFTINKSLQSLLNINISKCFDVIYFDAFAPTVQPELWTEEVFKLMYALTNTNGVLVTYSSKVSVRKALQAAGFWVEKIRGPIGKAEITRAIKK
ncbi:tRNA (5-methylaminomethyl-2-thiouridine)(34)-methyltransferase MnmD [Parasediminibacterium sp. JCM 36343]|uniref:tRNA (5-methylaminomethyl-2-thiouridine)(34)-methyltransferase MnmD n=1 Tax=Parasediminibacterium sp. JCM 36343 TaxID=3374279 RepID=UPI00397E2D9C